MGLDQWLYGEKYLYNDKDVSGRLLDIAAKIEGDN